MCVYIYIYIEICQFYAPILNDPFIEIVFDYQNVF